MATVRSAWTASVWGSVGSAHAERVVLAKGEDLCNICLEARVEVLLNPCKHPICLDCCNRLRAANIYKVQALLCII